MKCPPFLDVSGCKGLCRPTSGFLCRVCCSGKTGQKRLIIPPHLFLMLTPCIMCSFTLSVKKRVNVSLSISREICCSACWPEYCEHGSAAPVWFPSCLLHNSFSGQATFLSVHTRAAAWLGHTGSTRVCLFIHFSFFCAHVCLYNRSFI